MSADNGVYILDCKDQYRVVHAQAIDNLYWSGIDRQIQEEMIPERVVEYFGDCKSTQWRKIALRIASNIFKKLEYCEYGIQVLRTDKTWEEIIEGTKIIC